MTNDLAVVKKDVVDVVARKVQEFIKRGELHLPAGYSPDNAMKSAWLILQNTLNRDKKPVLQVCNKTSIANALLDMVVQGLNPMKKQGYFIAYGDQLVFQRSYFGTMALAKMIDDTIADIVAEVVYEGDTFKYAMVRGKKEITLHEQALENVNNRKIKAAYCMIIDHDGAIKKTEIMTYDEIKQAWKQSQMNPFDEKGEVKASSTHGKFTADMCKKTIINRACKTILNSSSDRHLLRQSIVRSGEIQAEIEVAEEIELNANSEAIDITTEPTVDAEFVDIPADEPVGAGEQQAIVGGPDF
ncbi:MAG TPA: RecT family recombinase [Candidatus Limnocylindrales bacterium]|nr:RecT family recombinase [Candidatus Limnocylindrales bacterium]